MNNPLSNFLSCLDCSVDDVIVNCDGLSKSLSEYFKGTFLVSYLIVKNKVK